MAIVQVSSLHKFKSFKQVQHSSGSNVQREITSVHLDDHRREFNSHLSRVEEAISTVACSEEVSSAPGLVVSPSKSGSPAAPK